MSSLPPRLTELCRRLSRDKVHWYQAHRRLLSTVHMVVASSTLVYDMLHDIRQPDDPFRRLQRLDILVLVLTILGRVAWRALFADINKFCGFRRPSRAYVLAVWFVTVTTTVPNLAVHVPLFNLNMQVNGLFSLVSIFSVGQPAFLVLSCALHVYLVNRFLMRNNDGHYEPTCELLMGLRHSRNFAAEATSSDTVSVVSLPSYRDEDDEPYEDAPDSFLSAAYAKQSERRRRACILDGSAPRHDYTDANGEEMARTQESSQPSGWSGPSTAALSPTHTTDKKRCPTVARFDYMPENHSTVNSGVTYPIVSWVFGISAAIIAYPIIRLSIENTKARIPSAYARYSLLSPIGMLMLCAYVTKHRLRKSLFERRRMSLPEPWDQLTNRQGDPRQEFVNVETGTTTRLDPRFRAPCNATLRRRFGALAVRSAYMERYNAGPKTCACYWGHAGRTWTYKQLLGPFCARFLFVAVAECLFVTGLACLALYPVGPSVVDRYRELPDVTVEDYLRLLRSMKLNTRAVAVAALISTPVFSYGLMAALSLILVHSRERDGVTHIPAPHARGWD